MKNAQSTITHHASVPRRPPRRFWLASKNGTTYNAGASLKETSQVHGMATRSWIDRGRYCHCPVSQGKVVFATIKPAMFGVD